jgi:erythronate-4-phosphate dehydrogenase
VIGCGNIGGRLAERLPALGLEVLKNDPPLAERAEQAGTAHGYLPLEAVLEASDVVTLHVPLTHAGDHPTYHLLDAGALRRMKSGAWLVNTCRGPVVSNSDLKAVRKAGYLGQVVLDVWENEPTPDLDLLPLVNLATPHIAGYSYDGKVWGTVMIYRALMCHLGREPAWDVAALFEPTPEDRGALSVPGEGLSQAAWLDALARQMYDIEADDARFRTLAALPAAERGPAFSVQRTCYPRRRTFACHHLPEQLIPPAYREAVVEGLRVSLVEPD